MLSVAVDDQLTLPGHDGLTMKCTEKRCVATGDQRDGTMSIFAVMLLAGLMWFGPTTFGWSDYNHYIQISLIAAFMFGVLFGWSASRQR